jgi:hypothetical protein
MLYDWYETGIQIRLYAPQPNVRRMLWFSRFFEPVGNDCHLLKPQREPDFPMGYPLPEAIPETVSRRNGEKKLAKAGQL